MTGPEQGPKAVVGNKGYVRFLKVAKGSVTIDEAAIKRDSRLDGKFVLTTNTDLPTAKVAQTYKSLWRVERTFREQKSTLEVRPLYHRRDDTSMGTSWLPFWLCAWRWICNNGLMTGRPRSPGPT
ncbi:MAG: transposase [Desulfobaccales bacterium]